MLPSAWSAPHVRPFLSALNTWHGCTCVASCGPLAFLGSDEDFNTLLGAGAEGQSADQTKRKEVTA